MTDNDPVDVAAVVAGRHGVSLAGVGQPSGTLGSPDVWVPDSSTWLLRLRGAASGFSPTNVTSIARSPVVVAMPEPVAAAVGWPREKLTWPTCSASSTPARRSSPASWSPPATRPVSPVSSR